MTPEPKIGQIWYSKINKDYVIIEAVGKGWVDYTPIGERRTKGWCDTNHLQRSCKYIQG